MKDLVNARRTVISEGPFDTACFHVQQAAEKYLKDLLAYVEELIPKTHDIEELQRLDYAVPSRYDLEFWPDRETATEGLHLAEQVREFVLAIVSKEALP
ncbi:MAG: hypothetical protein HW419_4764 [Deltaproteobacteria bacterium]|nr:hypothetical protein [Deltaproteobacteria bacterium]